MMTMSRVCAKSQNLSSRFLALLLSWVRAVLLVSCDMWPFCVCLAAIEERALARAVAMAFAASERVVPAWPMGIPTSLTRPQYLRRAHRRGYYVWVFSVIFS